MPVDDRVAAKPSSYEVVMGDPVPFTRLFSLEELLHPTRYGVSEEELNQLEAFAARHVPALVEAVEVAADGSEFVFAVEALRSWWTFIVLEQAEHALQRVPERERGRWRKRKVSPLAQAMMHASARRQWPGYAAHRHVGTRRAPRRTTRRTRAHGRRGPPRLAEDPPEPPPPDLAAWRGLAAAATRAFAHEQRRAGARRVAA